MPVGLFLLGAGLCMEGRARRNDNMFSIGQVLVCLAFVGEFIAMAIVFSLDPGIDIDPNH